MRAGPKVQTRKEKKKEKKGRKKTVVREKNISGSCLCNERAPNSEARRNQNEKR